MFGAHYPGEAYFGEGDAGESGATDLVATPEALSASFSLPEPTIHSGPRITQIIDLAVAGFDNSTAGANTYRDVTFALARLNTDDFDGDVSFFFEADLTSTVAGTSTAELYNRTDSTGVSGSEISTTATSGTIDRVRSGALSLSGDKIYSFRIKSSTSTNGSAQATAARIVIVQSGSFTKTQSQMDLGYEQSFSSTSTPTIVPHSAEFAYDASDFDGDVTVRYDAWLVGSADNAASSALYDVTAASIVSDSIVSTTNTAATLVSSDPITLLDGHIYRPVLYSATTTATTAEGLKIVFTQTGSPTRFATLWRIWNLGSAFDNATAYDRDDEGKILLDPAAYDVGSVSYAYVARLSSGNASGIAYSAPYSSTDASVIAGTDISVAGTTETQERSADFTIDIATEVSIALKTNNASYAANIYSAFIAATVLLSISVTADADAESLAAALPSPTTFAQQQVNISGSDQGLSASLPSPTIAAQQQVALTGDEQSVAFALPDPNVSAIQSATAAADGQSLALALPSPIIDARQTIAPSPSADGLIATLESPAIEAVQTNSTVADSLELSTALQIPTVSAQRQATIDAETLALNTALAMASVVTGGNAVIGPIAQGLTAALPTVTVETSQRTSATAQQLVLHASLPAPTIATHADAETHPGWLSAGFSLLVATIRTHAPRGRLFTRRGGLYHRRPDLFD